MNPVPIITGLGLVTPLGSSVCEIWSALINGKHITTHARSPFDSTSPDRVHPLAVAASQQAIVDSRWTRGSTTALVVGTSKGAIDAWLTAPPADSFLASVASAVRERCPLLDGPALTFSAACASGLHAVIRAAMMIRSGEADRVLVVAAEASVHPLFLGSFQRLGVLPREGVGCRPFDQDRAGFLMSEAAAAICLENAEARSQTTTPGQSARIYARIDRFAVAGDATHMTGSDPRAAALRRMLQRVVDRRPVDLIHAHGTGTIIHDPIELAAFEDECVIDGSDRPTVYSHKGALGHSLGASGLVSIVLSCQMHRHGIVLPNVQTRRPLPTRRVALTREAVGRPVNRSVAIASGFGGSVGVLSLCSP